MLMNVHLILENLEEKMSVWIYDDCKHKYV